MKSKIRLSVDGWLACGGNGMQQRDEHGAAEMGNRKLYGVSRCPSHESPDEELIMNESTGIEKSDQTPEGTPITKFPPDPAASAENQANGQEQHVPSANPSENNAAPDQRSLMQSLRQHEDEHLWRKMYLQKSFYLVGTVLYLTSFVVVLVGIGIIDLSDAVLITMLGTTVAHVVGILAIAFHWLYPHHD